MTTTDVAVATSRILVLLEAWGQDARVETSGEGLVGQVVASLEADSGLERSWQALAALTARIPLGDDVLRFRRRVALNGVAHSVAEVLASDAAAEFPARRVRFTTGDVVDVHDTSRTTKITGIQRVVRETVRRWERDHELEFVAWTSDATALRALTDWERASLLGLDGPHEGDDVDEDDIVEVLVPLRGALVVAELVAETWRTDRLGSIAAYPGVEVDVIGYDAVPMTSSETSHDGISGQYPLYLQAIARADRVGAISGAAADEFAGWAHMLGSTGLAGPDVRHVALAAEVATPSAADVSAARAALGAVEGRPTVLVVGSHEPRKNHLAVVQAAKTAWSHGLQFTLAFIGGASWSSDRFHDEIAALQKAKLPVTLISKATDELLAGAYEVADLTLFPSLHEGFGLPVAESLALGTPVITSRYGSMKEIIDGGGGGLLVDPRSDASLAAALERLLREPAVLAGLAAEARARTVRTWDAYAAELWSYFHA